MNGTLFILPWIYEHNGALWDLIHTLRSIDENWLAPHAVLLIGDMPPTLANGLLFQPMERAANVKWRRCTDVCAKLGWALNSAAVPERFVYLYDDTLFLQSVNEFYLAERVAIGPLLPGNVHSRQDHKAMKAMTEKALREAGLTGPLWDYETHTPRLFEKKKMQEVFVKFQPGVNHLLFSTLYYNWHYRTEGANGLPTTEVLPPTVLHKMDRHLVRFSDSLRTGLPPAPRTYELPQQIAYYHQHMTGKALLNYGSSDRSRTKALIEAIKQKFPQPGPYETAGTRKHLTSTLLTNGQLRTV